MFQRQLSTNALAVAGSAASTLGGVSTATRPPPPAPPLDSRSTTSSPKRQPQQPSGARTGPSGRIFQRQMTASQLGCSSATGAAPLASGEAARQRAAALLASVRGGGGGAAAPEPPTAAPADGQVGAKRAPKQKRIISRMLSISAIQATVGGGGGGSGANSAAHVSQPNAQQPQPGERPPSDRSNSHANFELASSSSGAGNSHHFGTQDNSTARQKDPQDANDHNASDKFDSSFVRSRSSSASSTQTSHWQQQQQQQQLQQQQSQTSPNESFGSSAESIQCVAFIDTPVQPLHHSSGNVCLSQGSHKSLASCSIDPQPALALCVGTSAGSVLLVNLSLPDNDDNRVLQLQSVNAEPMPHASTKLPGAILCIATFACEPRNALGSSPAATAAAAAGSGGQSGGAGGLGTPTNPSALDAAAAIGGAGELATAQLSASGADADPNRSGANESRSVQFLAVVSEKQARVYHLSNCVGSSASSPTPMSAPFASLSGGGGGGGGGNFGAAAAAVSVGPNQTISSGPQTAVGAGATQSASASGAAAAAAAAAANAAATDQHHSGASNASSLSHSGAHHLERNSSAEWPFAKLFANNNNSSSSSNNNNNANLFARCDLSESSFACRSNVVRMRSPDEHCLVSYLATGNLLVLALPRLNAAHAQPAAAAAAAAAASQAAGQQSQPSSPGPAALMNADFVPYSNARIAASMQFSKLGHCLYRPSATEVCKFTISAQYKALVNDMAGVLYVPREMPEMPRPNFFKSLLSSVSGAGAASSARQQSERDELFGELGAGKAQRGVAKHIGGSAALEKLKGAAQGTMGHEMRVAREGLDERGEKLSEIEDRTQHMMMQSEMYASAAHQLAQKFKDKKWYQF